MFSITAKTTAALLMTLSVVGGPSAVLVAAEKPPKPEPKEARLPTDLAPKLAAIPPNTWLALNLGWKGGSEVPACFDQANRLFFKYGGCGDKTPPVKISFPAGDHRHPNGYSNTCWVVNLAKGGWEMRRDYDCSWPTTQPANGCSRNYTYDSKRKVVWLYGGISDGGGGGGQWEMCYYDAKADKFTWPGNKNAPRGGDGNGGDVFAYDPIHDFLIMPRGAETMIYKPAEEAWESRSTPDAPATRGHYGSLAFDVGAKRLVYPHVVGTGKTSKEQPADIVNWGFDSKSSTWYEQRQEISTYDPETNKWELLAIKPGTPRPCWRLRCGLTYDSKNKVVVLVGGSTDSWDSAERFYNDVWVLDVAKATWTEMKPSGTLPTGNFAWRDNRHCAYDEADNVIFWQPHAGDVWAYKCK